MSIDKYVGCTVKIVYVDRRNQITQRNIEVREVRDGYVRAICLKSKGPRIFLVSSILAYEVIRRQIG